MENIQLFRLQIIKILKGKKSKYKTLPLNMQS